MSGDDGTDYTCMNFLSSLRSAPKKNLFKHLSLNTDLQEINQILTSPTGRIEPKISLPTSLDVAMTKTFVLELLSKYETQEEALKKWDGFIKSVSSPPDFQKFVKSLKQIEPDLKTENEKPNPEKNGSDGCQQKKGEGGRKLTRVYSLKKISKDKECKPQQSAEAKFTKDIRTDLMLIKDLLGAGQKFIRQA